MTTIPDYGAKASFPASGTSDIKGAAGAAAGPLGKAIPGDFNLAELFVWLGVTMKKTDQDIRAQMNEIQTAKERSQQFSALATELNSLLEQAKASSDKGANLPESSQLAAYRTFFDDAASCGSPPYKDAETAAKAAKIWSQIPWLGKLSPTAQDAIFGFFGDLRDDGKVHQNSIQKLADCMKDEVAAIGSSNELAMITLQSTMSARSQAIQLTSNMLQSFNDASMKCIGNIR